MNLDILSWKRNTRVFLEVTSSIFQKNKIVILLLVLSGFVLMSTQSMGVWRDAERPSIGIIYVDGELVFKGRAFPDDGSTRDIDLQWLGLDNAELLPEEGKFSKEELDKPTITLGGRKMSVVVDHSIGGIILESKLVLKSQIGDDGVKFWRLPDGYAEKSLTSRYIRRNDR